MGVKEHKKTELLTARLYKLLHYFLSVVLFFAYWLLFRYGDFSKIVFSRALRYDLYIPVVYAVLLIFFLKTYNGYLVGYVRIRQLAFSQFVSQLFAVTITIVVVLVAWMNYKPVYKFVHLLVLYIILDCLWSYSANYLFFKHNPKIKAVMLYGDSQGKLLDLDISGKPVERLISIEEEIFCSESSLPEVLEVLSGYDAFFAVGLSAECCDALSKYCITENKDGFFLPSVGGVIFQNAYHIQSFHEPLLAVKRKQNKLEYLFVKRAFDIFASLLGIIILSPLMLITAIAIKVYDGGPAIYRQTRLTTNGREFTLYKFRSMRIDAEENGKAVLSSGEKDDRITPVGKIIRAIRFDELPQLFNILKGDMTIVGPRPERPEIAEQYYETLPEFKLRLQVKAGLTGYAQVYGKYNTSPEQKLKFDLMYINRMSVFTDIRLMFATFGILFNKESTEGVEKRKLSQSSYENEV